MTGNPHILIVGPGSMGLMHAAILARTGCRVSLLHHCTERADALAAAGVTCTGAAGDFTVALPVTADADSLDHVDIAIILVKAFSTADALAAARPALSSDTLVLTLQNGLGNYEFICDCVGEARAIAGTTSSGAYRTSASSVHIAAIGQSQVGAAPAAMSGAESISELFTGAGLPALINEDFRALLWRKVIINVGINPLGALASVRNGRIVEIPDLRTTMRALVQEAVAVAHAEGINLSEDMVAVVEGVARNTAANRCSMLQDLEAGRLTEIDQINGAVVEIANRHGMAVPVNATIAGLIRGISTARREANR